MNGWGIQEEMLSPGTSPVWVFGDSLGVEAPWRFISYNQHWGQQALKEQWHQKFMGSRLTYRG